MMHKICSSSFFKWEKEVREGKREKKKKKRERESNKRYPGTTADIVVY